MKTIGIIGGMGPLATSDLFNRIVTYTKAHNDNQHIPMIIDNNTRIPDRTAAILKRGESPCRELVRSALRLENMGADFLIMPCNTAHYFYKEIAYYTAIPFLNMIEETVREIHRLGINTVGLLATDGALRSEIYDEMLGRYGIDCIKPTNDEQTHVMDMIYKGIKGKSAIDPSAFIRVLKNMEDRGADTFVLGCTELPLAFERFAIANKAINPTDILAVSAIKLAGGQVDRTPAIC